MWQRIRVGLWWGLSFAAAYALFVLVLAALGGSEPFERADTTLPKVVAAYFVGGLIGGGLFGLLLPLGHTRLGAALLGFIVAVPVMHVVMLAVDSSASDDPPRFVVTLMSAAILGPVCGLSMWYVNRRYEQY